SSYIGYNTNLSGALSQSVLNGNTSQPLSVGLASNSLQFGTSASVNLIPRLSLNGYINHRVQETGAYEYSDTQYGAGISYNYASPLFGFLNFSVGMVDAINKQGNTGMGLSATLSTYKRFGKWETSADFNYQQFMQTLGGFATTSSLSYGG